MPEDTLMRQKLANRGGTGEYATDAYVTDTTPDFPGDGSTGVAAALGTFFNSTIPSAGGLVHIAPGTHRIDADLTLEGGKRGLWFAPGAVLSVDTGKTLTINTTIHAGLERIFAGAGAVVLGRKAAPGGIRSEWFGALWDDGGAGGTTTDDTSAIAKALAAGTHHLWPDATARVSSLEIVSSRYIRTAGPGTTLKQISGSATQILRLTGSNIEIGDLTGRGNIDTDTGEWNHVVFIQNTSSVAQRHIRLGRIRGENIRGDVVSISGLDTSPVYDVRVESAYGSNVLRTVVSVIGGEGIHIGHVDGDNVGFLTFDCEPNDSSQYCTDIRVDWCRGAVVGAIGGNGEPGQPPYCGHISFGMLDLNPAHSGNSTPGYAAHDPDVGVLLRNFRSVHIESLYASDYNGAAIHLVSEPSVDDRFIESCTIDHLSLGNCSVTDSSYNAYVMDFGCRHLTISGGTVDLTGGNTARAGKAFVLTPSTAATTLPVTLRNIAVDGTIAWWTANSTFENCTIDNADLTGTYAFRNTSDSVIRNCRITIGRLSGYSSGNTYENVQAVVPGFVFDTGNSNHILRHTTVNGVYYRNQSWDKGHANAFGQGNHVTGGHAFQWVDANGKWRGKVGAPTGDLDGWIVETVAKRLTASVALSASATVALAGLDLALAANSGVYVLDYELAVDVSGGTAGLKPVFTLPANVASARFSAQGHGGAIGTWVVGASTSSPGTAYGTAFATASLTGAVIRGRLVVAMGGSAGTVSIGLVTGASAAGNVLLNSSVTVSRV